MTEPRVYAILLLISGMFLSFAGLIAVSIIVLYQAVDQNRGEGERKQHLLPRHVWEVTLSYVGLGIAAVIPMHRTLREGLAAISLVLGIHALKLVFDFHKQRSSR